MILSEISNLNVDRVEDPTHELLELNDVAKLKAENFRLKNALNEKNHILHSKEEEIWHLKKTVRHLRGEVRYCFEEINRLDACRAAQSITSFKSSYNNFRQNYDGT